jgi:hypothetical protein
LPSKELSLEKSRGPVEGGRCFLIPGGIFKAADMAGSEAGSSSKGALRYRSIDILLDDFETASLAAFSRGLVVRNVGDL